MDGLKPNDPITIPTVTGVDTMPGFLALAGQQAAEMGVQVDYRQGDMRQVSFPDEFDKTFPRGCD